MLKIIVVDDNVEALKGISELVRESMPVPHTILKFSSISDVVGFAQKEKPDILITDIKMPVVNGIELSKILCVQCPNLQIIFMSNYTTYVEDAFSARPIYYLLKPIDKEKLQTALDLAVHRIEKANPTLQLSGKNKTERISVKTIKYLESKNRYVYIYADENFEIIAKLDEIQKSLPVGFVRPHKSFLVSIDQIKAISNYKIELLGGQSIPCAKSKYKSVKEYILKHWGDNI